MKKVKAFIAAGAVAGLSALPLAASAANPTTANITASVGASISITATNVNIGSIVPGNAGTGSTAVNVRTNTTKGFTVSVKGGNLASANNTIAPNTSAAAGTEGWSIMDDSNNPIAPSSTDQLLWTYTAAAGNTQAINQSESFGVTVGTESTTPNGTYTGTITLTAAATE